MNIYIMRHSITVWNEKGIIQGRSNNRLSKAGIELAKNVAKKYKDTKFDIIYASPLMRTMQTANIMNVYHNVKIVKDERIIEVGEGDFTRRLKSSLSNQERLLIRKRDKKYKLESYENVYKRVDEFLQDLKQNCKFDNVLIVSHNLDASFMECVLSNIKVDVNNDKHTTRFDNAQIKHFKI